MTEPIGEMNAPEGAMSVDDIATALGDGIDDKTTDKNTAKPKTEEPKLEAEDIRDKPEEDEEEVEEKEEIADETEDEKGETLDLEDELEYTDTPKRQAILKDFPELFKKYPTIEKAIYREREYSEIYPSIADAKASKEELSVLNSFRGELLDGNVGNILKSVKDTNPKAFNQIAENFIFTLGSIDQNAQFEVFNQIGKSLLSQAFNAGKSTKNEQLQYAAQHIHNFFYNSPDVQPYSKSRQQDTVNPEAEKLTREKQEFESSRLNLAVNDITAKVDNVLKNTVNKHIDPNSVMTPYIKRNATNEAIDSLRLAIRDDKRLQSTLNKLYETARSDGYSETSKNKIKKVLLNKAQSVLSETLTKVRADALKGLGSRAKQETRDEKPVKQGRPATSRNNSSPEKKQEILNKTKNMSTADALAAMMGE